MSRQILKGAGAGLALTVLATLGALIFGVARPAQAHETAGGRGEETIAPVMKQALPEAVGRDALMITVSYAPGQASTPHMHPGSIFAYVLEGEVESQLDGQPARVFKQGEAWYEPPNARHLVSRNASQTRPAKLLVYAIVADKAPVKVPLPQ